MQAAPVMHDKVISACCTFTGLGVPTSALRLFEVREVASGAELSEGTQRIAVALPDSSALRQSADNAVNLEWHAELRTVCLQPDALRPVILRPVSCAGLSLGAIEDTMSENKRLMATNAHSERLVLA